MISAFQILELNSRLQSLRFPDKKFQDYELPQMEQRARVYLHTKLQRSLYMQKECLLSLPSVTVDLKINYYILFTLGQFS